MTDTQITVAVISGLLTLISAVVVAWLTGRSNTRQASIEAQATPYAELAKRVAELERADQDKSEQISALRSEVGRLRANQDDDRRYITRLLDAWRLQLPGITPPQPLPGWLTQKEDQTP